jgi:UDPglucose--hexose-1-phosphate uridylyltransferase
VVRAFPNKFPVVTGHHEVIVDCPDHALSFGRLPDRHAELVIKAIGDRYRALAAKSGVKYIQVFKNCGVAAGASLEHTHWQVISIPVIPDMLVREYDQIQSYRRQHGSCGFCRLAQGELNRQGIIESHADYLVTAPFVSRFPHEIWVIPRRHEPDFGCLGAGGAGTLGRILRRTLRRLERALNYPPYNLIIHTKPLTGSYPEFHWHIEILPRLTAIAGFELGTGIFINPVPPHESAALLRGTDPEIRRDPERNGGNSHG